MSKIRIVFFGTPFFALHSLKTLINENYDVVGVVTALDKPKGRGLKLKASKIKCFAKNNSIIHLNVEEKSQFLVSSAEYILNQI